MLAATTRYEPATPEEAERARASFSPRKRRRIPVASSCRRGPPRSIGAPDLGLRPSGDHHGSVALAAGAIQLPRGRAWLTGTTDFSDQGRTIPIQRMTRPRDGRFFKYRPPPVGTVHPWNASLAACRAGEPHRKAAALPGVGSL